MAKAPAKAKDDRKRPGKRKAGNGRTSPAQIRRNEKKAEAVELRLHGWPYQAIAEQIGYKTAAAAYQLVQEAMTDRVYPAVAELRDLTLDRLDAMLTGLMPNAVSGDIAAVQAVLDVIEKQARITGMFAPVKAAVKMDADVTGEIEHTGTVSHEHIGVIEVQFVQPDGKVIDGYAKRLAGPDVKQH